MEDNTKIIIALIIAFTVIVVVALIKQPSNPTTMPEKVRQQIIQEENI